MREDRLQEMTLIVLPQPSNVEGKKGPLAAFWGLPELI
jgi:hypothetical protein